MSASLSGLFQFEPWGVANILASVANISMGVFVLSRNSRNPVNRAYFLFTIPTFFWAFSFGMASILKSTSAAEHWTRIAYLLGVPYISIGVYNFSVALERGKPNPRAVRLAILLALPFGVLWALNPGGLWEARILSWGNRYMIYGRGLFPTTYYVLILVLFWTYALLAFRHFIAGYRRASDPFRRDQFRIIIIAYGLAYTGGIDFLAAWNGRTYPFGFVSLTVLTFVMAYAVVRHRLFDVRTALKKITLALLIYAALLSAAVLVGLPTFRRFAQAESAGLLHETFAISLAMGLIISAGPLIYAFVVRHSFWLKSHASMGLTHELKSPLSAITTAIDEIQYSLDSEAPNSERALEYARLAGRNGDRLTRFVNNLLDIVRIGEGAVTLDRSTCDLVELTREVVADHAVASRAKIVDVIIDAGGPVTVDGDAGKLRQAISNIVSNAIKHSNGGAIRIAVRESAHDRTLSVHDQGAGISKEHLARIFDKFFQANKAARGTGLGLAIAKAWVEAHGGRIWAESEGEGKGTTVTFTVPA